MALHDGQFYIAEGGELKGSRILRVNQNGQITADGRFATMGDHHTNGPAIGPEGWVYFGLGTPTNSGAVGVDNAHSVCLCANRTSTTSPVRMLL
jgi:hypothetical protein